MISRIALAALLAGCTGPGIAPGSASPTGEPSVEATTTATRTSGPTASPAVTAPSVPAGFPVHGSMITIEPGARYIAAWKSDALPPEVYSFYVEQLPAAGFAVDLLGPGGEASIIRFTAPDGIAYQLDLTGRGPLEVSLGPPHD